MSLRGVIHNLEIDEEKRSLAGEVIPDSGAVSSKERRSELEQGWILRCNQVLSFTTLISLSYVPVKTYIVLHLVPFNLKCQLQFLLDYSITELSS